jgi:Short C-terminal domain
MSSKKVEQKMDEAHRPAVQQVQQSSAYDKLAKLAALRDRGIVTEQEFQEQVDALYKIVIDLQTLRI